MIDEPPISVTCQLVHTTLRPLSCARQQKCLCTCTGMLCFPASVAITRLEPELASCSMTFTVDVKHDVTPRNFMETCHQAAYKLDLYYTSTEVENYTICLFE